MIKIMKITVFILGIFITAAFWLPEDVQAASFKIINVDAETAVAKERTVGGYEFSSHDGELTVKKGQTKRILVEDNFVGSIITNGKQIYFCRAWIGMSKQEYRVYSASTQDSEVKTLFKINEEVFELTGYYQGRLLYVVGLDPGRFCSYDLKTGQRKKLAGNTTTADQYGRYVLLCPYMGDYSPSTFCTYDLKKEKKTRITKKSAGFQIVANKIYYAEFKKFSAGGRHILNVKKIDLSGKHKKTLIKSLKAQYIIEYKKNFVRYMDYRGKKRIKKF